MIYLIAIFWSFKEAKSALFYLYFAQLKEYHLGRFLFHFKTRQGKSLLLNKLIILKIIILFLFLINFPLTFYLFFFLYFIEFLNTSYKFFQDKLKKPVFTKKTIFLSFILFLFIFVFLFLSIRYYFENLIFLILTFDIFSPLIFSLLIFSLQPLTIWKRKKIIKEATLKREKHNLKVIGITGSYGKTTTKEFLATILAEKFNVLKTENHKNSEMGISQTILEELNEGHEIFVCEMGAYNQGGIELLADIVKPEIGIVTGINEQHLSLFGSMEKLIEAEGGKELINKAKLVLFNGDDKLCLQVYKETKKEKRLCLIKEKSDYWVSDFSLSKKYLSFKVNEKEEFKVKTYGKHNLSNLLLAIASAKELGMSWDQIKKGCFKIVPEMTGIRVFDSNHGFKIIDSSYSANPTGVMADLNYLKLYPKKRVIVMPCLIELGKEARRIHKKIGKKIDKICDLAIITTPDYFEDLNSEKAVLIEDSQKITRKLKSFCSKKDTVLIEGRIKKGIIKKL